MSSVSDFTGVKRKSLTINTSAAFDKYKYSNALNSQRTKFGWNLKREFKPNTRYEFDFNLMKYDFKTGNYYNYSENFHNQKRNKKSKITFPCSDISLFNSRVFPSNTPDSSPDISVTNT